MYPPTPVHHGPPGVASAGPPLKRCRPPGFVALGGLVLSLPTGDNRSYSLVHTIARWFEKGRGKQAFNFGQVQVVPSPFHLVSFLVNTTQNNTQGGGMRANPTNPPAGRGQSGSECQA